MVVRWIPWASGLAVSLLMLVGCGRLLPPLPLNQSPPSARSLDLGTYDDRLVTLSEPPQQIDLADGKRALRAQVRIAQPQSRSRYSLVEVYAECDPKAPERTFIGLERVTQVDELLAQRHLESGLGITRSLQEQPPSWSLELLRRYCPVAALKPKS
jgi:hypothetical protein